MKKGIFITFEGPEGSGKTTQIALLSAHLRSKGHRVLVTREPGGTEWADGIRKLLLDGGDGLSSMAELFLYEADRAQHVHETLMPALRQGTIILCDRYTDSTLAYQGYGRKLDMKTIEALNHIASGDLKPHLTILLDVPVERGLKLAMQKRTGMTGWSVRGWPFIIEFAKDFCAWPRKNPPDFVSLPNKKQLQELKR